MSAIDFERELEYAADAAGEEEGAGPDLWWARCLAADCEYEFETYAATHPLCPACERDAEVV